MSRVGDKLRERWAGLKVRIVVEEWRGILPEDSQGEPAIYGEPFTLTDTAKFQGFIRDDSPEGFAAVVIAKALDEDGDRLFDVTDRTALLEHAEAAIVTRVGQELMASVSLEDARGNSEPTRGSRRSSRSGNSSAARSASSAT